ncbi:MAG: YwaF family protein [Oscillospiraceae bacterium]|nr:YwaF family protein [Oscillospiraceae bacterium]
MKEFFAWLFSENNSTLQIGLFDGWHFLYLFIIFGGTLALSLIGRKFPAKKAGIQKLMAYLTVGLYVIDFFIMPLSDSYDGISAYKLPFNICTIMAVLVPFVQFNPKFAKLRQPVVTLSIASSLMWMCYPGSALGGQPPFSYIIFQTFMYHGFLFCWGVLNLSYGDVSYRLRDIWKEFVGILLILVWAAFGNAVYDRGYNWFFIETSIFPFLPDKIMPVAVVVSVFGVCLVIYGIYFALKALSQKKVTV